MKVVVSIPRTLSILGFVLMSPFGCLALDLKLPTSPSQPAAPASLPSHNSIQLVDAAMAARIEELSTALKAVSEKANNLESAMRATNAKSAALDEEDRVLRRRSARLQLWQLAIQACTALVIAVTVWQAARAAFLNRFNVQATAFLQLRDAFARLRPQLPGGFGSKF